MKKIIALVLVLIICLSFAACKKNDGNGGEATTAAESTTEATTAAATRSESTTADPNYDPRDPAIDDIF